MWIEHNSREFQIIETLLIRVELIISNSKHPLKQANIKKEDIRREKLSYVRSALNCRTPFKSPMDLPC